MYIWCIHFVFTATGQVNAIPMYKMKRVKVRMLSNWHKVSEKVKESVGTPEPVYVGNNPQRSESPASLSSPS